MTSTPPEGHQGRVGYDPLSRTITDVCVEAGEVFGELCKYDTVMEEVDSSEDKNDEMTQPMSIAKNTLRFTEEGSKLKSVLVSKTKEIG